MNIEAYLIGYLAVMNLWGYISMVQDKHKAVKHQYRTPERHLWFIAWIGGVFGSLIGMQVMHHKTRHPIFRYGMPLLCAGHVLLWGFIFLHL